MRKLPVFAAFKHVWATVFNNAGAAFRLSWPWLLVMAATMALFLAGIASLHAGLGSAKAGGEDFFLLLIVVTVFVVAFASIAVNWHRFVLLDEMPKGMGVLRIDSQVWRYIGNLFLIGLIVGLPFLIVGSVLMYLLNAMLGHSFFGMRMIFGGLVFFAVLLAVNVIVNRLAIKLPAIALGRRDYGLEKAWNDSTGNFLPIAGYLVLLYLSVFIPQKLLEWVSTNMAGSLGLLGAIQVVIVSVLVQWFALIVGISGLTTLYGFFAEKRNL
jgi:hypothetical protein